MTLQQLKYVTTVAQTGTISDAAKKLFISQPSLTKAVRELEKEMEITIFERTNRGIVISKEGETFLGYARQMRFTYSLIAVTTPEPTVLPPSRIAKRRPSSIAIG